MSILEPALAQKFIDKTAKHLEYNLNIMNDKGIIIASKDTSRIGDFHEVAYGLLTGKLETGVVKEDGKYIGTKPGINMFIDYKDKHVGIICVTGNPDTVHTFAGLVKTSMEAMLEYELQMEWERRRRGKAEKFLYYTLFEENVDLSAANTMADDLKLNRDLLRVFINIQYPSDFDAKTLMKVFSETEEYSHQDIITVGRNDDIILFKVLEGKDADIIKNYKYILTEYLNTYMKKLPEEYDVSKISFFVGSLQKNLDKYRVSYVHAQQLSLQVKEKQGIHFFSDYVLDYYRHLVTMKVYDDIFSVYDSIFSEEDKKVLAETVEVLVKNNYNVVNSAKELFIHRNTLLFRLNKMKETLNIDPIANASDREFFNELAYYFSKK